MWGLKLVKKDFGKWDKEELSIIITGYTAKDIADHILENQKRCDMLQRSYDESERCLIERGVLINKLQKIVDRLEKEIKNLPQCFSKECMGCEIDMQRHLLTKILEGKK